MQRPSWCLPTKGTRSNRPTRRPVSCRRVQFATPRWLVHRRRTCDSAHGAISNVSHEFGSRNRRTASASTAASRCRNRSPRPSAFFTRVSQRVTSPWIHPSTVKQPQRPDRTPCGVRSVATRAPSEGFSKPYSPEPIRPTDSSLSKKADALARHLLPAGPSEKSRAPTPRSFNGRQAWLRFCGLCLPEGQHTGPNTAPRAPNQNVNQPRGFVQKCCASHFFLKLRGRPYRSYGWLLPRPRSDNRTPQRPGPESR